MNAVTATRGAARAHPRTTALIAFVACYFLAILHFRRAAASDPTSLFFDPIAGFTSRYSAVRKAQADGYLMHVDEAAAPHQAASPRLAVGIATVQRQGHEYLSSTFGSVLAGLDEREREGIHVAVLIADADPEAHAAFHQPWLQLADQVLTYRNASEEVQDHLAHLMATDPGHRVKPLFDYARLLRACYDTGAEFVAMLEDDIIAADGWYHRSMAALQTLSASPEADRSVYVRLFFDSGLHGWNSEFWPRYLLESVCVAGLVVIAIRVLQWRSALCDKFFTSRAILATVGLCTPAVIALCFAAGRLTVSPLPTGLVRMDNYGCCSQALVFPRRQIPELLDFYEQRGAGFVDMLTEEYADARGLARWAVVPSVFQHVGARSSKGDDTSKLQWNRNVAENIRNVDFEQFDAEQLSLEHAAAIEHA